MDKKAVFLDFNHTLYLKGFAIIIIIISHIGNYSGKTWFTPLGGVGVAIFLFCSGYGITQSYKKHGLCDFWKKRFVFVYIPFVIIESVASMIFGASFTEYLMDIFLIKSLTPYGWYMQYLFICYILFYIGNRFVCSGKIRMFLWEVISVISFCICGNLRAEQSISFLCGIIVSQNVKFFAGITTKKKTNWGIALIICSVFILGIKQADYIREFPLATTFLNILIKCGFMFGVILCSSNNRVFLSGFIFFGHISFMLYLIHCYLMIIVANNITGIFLINASIMCVLSILIAMVANYLIQLIVMEVKKWCRLKC